MSGHDKNFLYLKFPPYLIYGTRFMAAQNFFTGPFLQQKLQFVKDMQRLVR